MGCDRNAREGCLVACGVRVWTFLLGCFNSVGTGKAAAVKLLVAGLVGGDKAIAVVASVLGGAIAIAGAVSGGGTSIAMALLVAGC